MGSEQTLLDSASLETITFENPVETITTALGDMVIYEKPIPGAVYVSVIDTAQGLGKDSSTDVVIKVSQPNKPAGQPAFTVVATFENKDISPYTFPTVVNTLGKMYNNAHILIELNDQGETVAHSLWEDFEYENLVWVDNTESKQVPGTGNKYGVKTSPAVKRKGCQALKTIVEAKQLDIRSYEILQQLAAFISKGNSYEAESGSHDDLVMPLVIFGWLTTFPFFTEISNANVKKILYGEKLQDFQEETLPFIIVDNGKPSQPEVQYGGLPWYNSPNENTNQTNNSQNDTNFWLLG